MLKTSTGQFASALKPVFTLIDTRHWYVVANFRETQIERIETDVKLTQEIMRRASCIALSVGELRTDARSARE